MSEQVIIFDMDDTLYLERDYIFSGFFAIEEFITSKGIKNNFSEIAKAQYKIKPDGTVLNRAISLLGTDLPSSISINSCLDVYREHVPTISLCKDTLSLFDRLPENIGTGLISDGRLQGQMNKAKSLELEKYIDLIIFTDTWGMDYWKPHERAYLAVMDHFKSLTNPSFTYIADNPKKDFISPQALGWNTVFINREHSLYAAQWTENVHATQSISSLDQFNI